MTFPPLKSMYLLRGVGVCLAVWFALGLWWHSTTSVFVTGDTGYFVLTLLIALAIGWGYATITEDANRTLSLITDHELPDYERETLAAIRAASPWAKNLSTQTLRAAYLDWCHLTFDNTPKGEWVNRMIPADIDAFLSWAFTRPIDRY